MRMIEVTAHRKKRGWISHRKGKIIRVHPKKATWTYRKKDVGAIGIGEKVLPTLKKGTLGGKGFFTMPEEKQKAILAKIAREQGEKVAMNKIGALGVLLKRTKPTYAKRAMELKHWVAGEFVGRKEIGFPLGLKRRR
jgi:hypothetical protein